MFETLASPEKPLNATMSDCRNVRTRPIFVNWFVAAVFLFLPLCNSASADIKVSSVRIWPAPEYTRLTLESAQPIQYSLSIVKNPDRVAIDLEQVVLTPELEKLAERIDAADPYIQAVRIGRFKPGILRLVLDLKTQAVPQAFVLKPVGDYGHRLVLDLYPVVPPDPLMALLNENTTATLKTDANPDANINSKAETRSARTSASKKHKPEMIRLITVAIDPGHGG